MKKIHVIIGMLFASTLSFTSCQQDVEVWNSETLEYSGRYVIELKSEDMTKTLVPYDGTELRIYNTSANVANEVWMDDEKALFPLKCKFSFTGTPASFKSTNVEFEKLTNNVYAISVPTTAPTTEGQTIEEERDYLRAAVLDGKITPKSFTTKGGNITDGLSIKIVLYSGTAIFASQTKPEKDWKDPTKPEYFWVLSSVTHDAAKDETYVVNGYIFTGFPEDEF